MASPTYQAKQNAGGSAAANVTCNVPTNSNGWILIFVLSKDDAGTVTWPGGWTPVIESTANSAYLGIGWRIASSEPASYTWNFSSTWRDCVMMSYSGIGVSVNPLDPDTPPAGNTGSGSVTSITAPDMTTTTIDTTMLCIYTNTGISGWSAAPTNWTQRDGASGTEQCVDDRQFSSAGTQSGAVQGSAFSTGAWKGFSIGLQSVADDQHYQEPPKFPGVFNLDARRMI